MNESVREIQLRGRYCLYGIPWETAKRWAREDAMREERKAADRPICTCVDHLPLGGTPLPECPRHNPTDRTIRHEEAN